MNVLRGFGSFIFTIVLYLGLPLLGWGLDDLRGFFSLNQRMGYAVFILILSIAAGYQAIAAPEGLRGSKGQEEKLVSRQSIVRVVVILLLLGALFFLPFADRLNIGVMFNSQAVRWAGLVLFVLGTSLVFWSGLILGRFYSGEVTIQKDHLLITSGLYRYIRHPRYLGGIILGIGLSLIFSSWIGLALSIPFIGLILLRIRDEEALMYKEFGQESEEYCKQSWRLIPFLY
jgi:protein-S-isoprenylcysteine O-methyltransferase Ste14